ncbi:hypothetical protein RHGRI_021235 [Rhododendron griersonianum]|uniref:Myb/SANT-like domain-containing protein n=1 Tax=Rhododendron griersonianum TaxID=479676 RepID=A0AAV6JJR6_9ERIC|nr:hypothetical protein RHGRI_021235 [Rhododendron griersonianum]
MGKGRQMHSSASLITTYSNRTEGPSKDGIRCGKWLLQSTCVRRGRGMVRFCSWVVSLIFSTIRFDFSVNGSDLSIRSLLFLVESIGHVCSVVGDMPVRILCIVGTIGFLGQPLSLKFEPSTPTSKRKRRASSPTPSANSSTGENSVQVPIMSRKKLDPDNWSYENTEIFLQIMLEEARKDHSTNSNKTRKFNSLQWAAILEELKKRTHKTDYTPIKIHQKFDRLKKEYRLFKDLTERSGLGWDPISQTVTASAEVWLTYLQANKDAGKYIGAPSLKQEQALRNQGKAIKRSDSMSVDSRKRMSDGSGGICSKSMRCEQKEAYDRVAFANQKKGEYFETLTQKRLEAKNYSIEACLEGMNPLKPFVSEAAFYKAYDNSPLLVKLPFIRHMTTFLRESIIGKAS